MSDQSVPIIRPTRLRQWRGSGARRTLAGRWDKARIAQAIEETPHKKFTLGELAKLVYGSNTQSSRENARKHLPSQRTYMLSLMKPFVTEYGPRGVIENIKFYEKDNSDDRAALSAELARLLHRNELSQDRYDKLRIALSLPPPTVVKE
jgi:hypothetical protein